MAVLVGVGHQRSVVECGCRRKVARLVWNSIRSFGKFRMPITVDYYMTLNSPFTFLGCALLAEIAQLVAT
jgi:hypothetical protein